MKYIIHIYQWCIAIPLLALATVITALTTSAGCMLGFGKWAGYYPQHIWAKLWCILMFVSIEVRGRENIKSDVSYIFVANHQGAYDIFSIYGYLNHKFYWMMKKSLSNIPFVGMACRSAGHILVDRSSASAIKHTMEHAEQRLQGGNSLVVFPEGARSYTGAMTSFKRGAFILAKEFKLPVVPITIDGSFKVMPRTTYNIKPGKIVLTIHAPQQAPTNNEEMEKLMHNCYDTINSTLTK